MDEKYTIQVLHKASNIIDILMRFPSGATLAELCKAMNMNKTTLFRILLNLQELGYVQQNADSGKYRLGYRFVEISNFVLSKTDIRQIAHPYLEELSARISEVVHLIVLDGDEGLYIDKVENFISTIKMYSQVGRHMRLHCTAAGKVFLSEMEPSRQDAIIAAKGLEKRTEKTITDAALLKRELLKIKEQGYAVDEMENEDGIQCVAVPVYGYNGKIVAVVSAAGTTITVTKERIPSLAAEIMKTAAIVSREIGGQSRTVPQTTEK